MNPLQKNKIDINSLSPEEQRLFRLYGKLPSKSDHFAKHLKERKYFDSGDYALSKAGKADSVDTGSVGSQHPVPENIPHLSSPVGPAGSGGTSGLANGLIPHLHHPHGSHNHHHHHQAGSPVKESSFLHRETSADALEEASSQQQQQQPPRTPQQQTPQANQGKVEAIPIRR